MRQHNREAWQTIGVTIIIVVLVVAGACWNDSFSPARDRAIGENIYVTGARVPDELRATALTNVPLPVQAQGRGPVVEVSPFDFSGKYSLEFGGDYRFDINDPTFVATKPIKGGTWWFYERAAVDENGNVTIKNAGHTVYWPFTVDLQGLLSTQSEIFTRTLSTVTSSHSNDCTQPGAPSDYRVDHVGNAALSTCFYVENAQLMLYVTNKHPLPVRVTNGTAINYLMPGASEGYRVDVAYNSWMRLDVAYDMYAMERHQLHTAMMGLRTVAQGLNPSFDVSQFNRAYPAAFDQMITAKECAYTIDRYRTVTLTTKIQLCLTEEVIDSLFSSYADLMMSFIEFGELPAWTEQELARQATLLTSTPTGQIFISRTTI